MDALMNYSTIDQPYSSTSYKHNTDGKTTHMLHVKVLDAVLLEHGADQHHVAEKNDVPLRELAQNAICEKVREAEGSGERWGRRIGKSE